MKTAGKTGRGEWSNQKAFMKKADEFLNSLGVNIGESSLNSVIHQLVWHLGIDPVRWINENKDLVRKISHYQWDEILPEDVKKEITSSISSLRRS